MPNLVTLKAISEEISIADGNTKLGAVPNVSLVPIRDCAHCEGCGRMPKPVASDWKPRCYALGAYRMYPEVRFAWGRNSKMARKNRARFFELVSSWFARKSQIGRQPRFFRWHVAGDFLDQDYVDRCLVVARENPETRFLAFTKRSDLDSLGCRRTSWLSFRCGPGFPTPPLPELLGHGSRMGPKRESPRVLFSVRELARIAACAGMPLACGTSGSNLTKRGGPKNDNSMDRHEGCA